MDTMKRKATNTTAISAPGRPSFEAWGMPLEASG
jgi:hypothetical protein